MKSSDYTGGTDYKHLEPLGLGLETAVALTDK